MAYHLRHLHLTACQLHELWTCVKKKEGYLTPLEHMLDIYGDTWVWIAFAPITKVVPAWVAGKRTRQESGRLIQRLQARTDGSIPFFTSDEIPHDAAALLEVYGQTRVPLRTGRPGRLQGAYKVPLALSFASYHFVVPHRGLRQRLAHPLPTKGSGSLKRWVQRTPAMAAGITDHIWTMDELLSFRVPPRCVWPSTPNRQHGNVPH
jgi:hypothetical protein